MAEALVKLKDGFLKNCSTGDTDGSLLTNLIEALTTGARLNVGQHGRTTYTPSNYTIGGGGDNIVDDHLEGIDDELLLKATTSHKNTHKSAGGDAFTSSDLLEAVVKRLQVTGPVTLLLGAVADGKYLKRSGTGLVGDDPPGMSAHALGGSYHSADSLANLNAKVTGGSLDFTTATRTPTIHNIGSNLRHAADTLANLNALISDATLDTNTASRPPSSHALHSHSSCTLAQLNADISNATLDTNTASRPPSGSASGDLSGSYPSPTVAKLQGQPVQAGAPATRDILQWSGAAWNHVAGLIPDYDSGWFTIHYSTANDVAKTHSLGVVPRQVQVYVSTDSGTTAHLAGWQWHHGEAPGRGTVVTNITSTTLRVKCGTESAAGCYDTYGMGGTRVYFSSGKARVLCWK